MHQDLDRLAKQFERAYGSFKQWDFEYVYPGALCYHHRKEEELDVCFTPDHDEKDMISIQVHHKGRELGEGALIPFTVRTVENLFNAVKPWLEKYNRGA